MCKSEIKENTYYSWREKGKQAANWTEEEKEFSRCFVYLRNEIKRKRKLENLYLIYMFLLLPSQLFGNIDLNISVLLEIISCFWIHFLLNFFNLKLLCQVLIVGLDPQQYSGPIAWRNYSNTKDTVGDICEMILHFFSLKGPYQPALKLIRCVYQSLGAAFQQEHNAILLVIEICV